MRRDNTMMREKAIDLGRDTKINRSAIRGRFLIVDDELSSILILQSILEANKHRSDSATSATEMKQMLSKFSFDIIFLDYRLGETNGLELLPFLIREYPFSKIIIISAHGSIHLAVETMQQGASGFITKPFDETMVEEEINRALQGTSPASDAPGYPDNLTGLIGISPPMHRIHEQIIKMKDVDSTVLIYGESGTGKELVARALHNLSHRSNQRFEAINCAAIPENLLEAELFGSKKGAFTDAKTDRKGLFEICSDGTLLLDEVGEMPLHLQSKLLRALQEKEITPLGSSQSVQVRTRVLAATNKNLDLLVREGKFRNDLFYRVSVLQIQIPPLRERVEDIAELARFFIRKISKRLQKEVTPPTSDILIRLASYDWPGNIRELQNALERAIVMASGDKLDIHDIFSHTESSLASEEVVDAIDISRIRNLTDAKEEFEKNYLERLLKAARGNVSQASQIAGRIRTDMYRLFSKHNIDPSRYKPQ